MATVLITLKVMPTSPTVDMDKLKKEVLLLIHSFASNKEERATIEPIAFGLNALSIIFDMDEEKGSVDALEEQINSIEDVESVEVTDVRRAIG